MAQKISMPGLSLHEKDRRYSLLKDKLKGASLSALIVYGGTQLGVPIHYLTKIWGTKNNMIIFPAEGEPIFIIPTNSGLTPQLLVEQGCWIPAANILLSTNPAHDAAKLIIRLKLQNSRIGIDSYRFWPVKEYKTFVGLCPKSVLVDAHRLFGEVRGPKSAEELAILKNAIRISDFAHYAFLANLRPGMTEEEAAGKAEELLDAYDVGDRIILIHSQPDAIYPNRPGKAVIQKPNPVTFSPEFSRNAGYGAQMIRSYWWEKPKGIYQKMFELWAEMRKMILQEFRPGEEITTIGKKIENLVANWGFECDKLGHSIGISYGDAPYITAGSHQRGYIEWITLPGEVYAVHPMIRCRGYVAPFTMIGDMYFIGRERTEIMTTALPGLPEMIPY